ncbi:MULTISPECIES: phosphoethanolamine transferase [Mesorhizobium]|uniref:Phosphoethanolamine--lipid A transferase n=1 Tax=Mesorhizobium denitrificans TaxID=2294114 RepID=A0A371XCF1_9HYPH|nr:MULTISPECIES: phosphoethanolamine--lipid A transferase [Mesorhizobium]RFC66902.1 phosphoethanolamine--lipid A transferase [Mesorhizobium denitrificans]
MSIRRLSLSSTALSLLVASYILLLLNISFWRKALAYFDDDWMHLAELGLILLLLHFVVLLAFSSRWLTKPVFIFFIMAGAAASYFVDAYGVVIDRDMLLNAVVTTSTEAGHLITPALLKHIALFGVLPSLFVAWVDVKHLPLRKKLQRNTALILVSLLVAVAVFGLQFSTFASMWREQRVGMMSNLVPATPLIGAISLGVRQFREVGIKAEPYGTDAHLGSVISASPKKVLTVIVVGETARAMNFSLNGYPRETNPELQALNALNFTNVTSCGTATAVSLPCMFSHFGRAQYSNIRGRGSENLMDVLTHAGLRTEWWENNTGPKNVADRIPVVEFYHKTDPAYCAQGECRDDILVDYLRDHISSFADNSVLVLHTGGSHGPAYYLRYPQSFEKFTPACHTAQLSDCTTDEIVNAYDNTILFTDHVLAGVIDVLKQQDGLATAMIYMSDHGESLGENGIYLHGAPYFIAPKEQTSIPMIAWFSDSYKDAMRLDENCIRNEASKPFSHDNLFSTVLGMMDVNTSVYRPEQDAFAACRNKVVSAQ